MSSSFSSCVWKQSKDKFLVWILKHFLLRVRLRDLWTCPLQDHSVLLHILVQRVFPYRVHQSQIRCLSMPRLNSIFCPPNYSVDVFLWLRSFFLTVNYLAIFFFVIGKMLNWGSTLNPETFTCNLKSKSLGMGPVNNPLFLLGVNSAWQESWITSQFEKGKFQIKFTVMQPKTAVQFTLVHYRMAVQFTSAAQKVCITRGNFNDMK